MAFRSSQRTRWTSLQKSWRRRSVTDTSRAPLDCSCRQVPPRVLHPHDPHAPDNTAEFSFKDRSYKVDTEVDHTAWHLAVDGVSN